MNNNPVLVILNGLAAVISLTLVALNALGITHLESMAVTAVVAAVTAWCNLIGLAIRAAVVPVGVHAEQVAQALATPPPGTPDRTFTWTGGPSQAALAADVVEALAQREAAGA